MAVRSHTPTAVEIARSHLDGQRRLLDDAERRLELAAEARASAERVHGAAEEAHALALAASSERPDDQRALGFLALAVARVQRDRMTLDAAIQAHAEAKQAFDAFAAHVEKAERDAARVTFEAELTDPRRIKKRKARGSKLFALLAEAFDELDALRRSIVEENELATTSRALGSTLEATDGLPEAAGFAAALLERGVDLAGAGSPGSIRWSLDLAGTSLSTSASAPSKALLDLAAIVARALSHPPSVNGTHALRQELAAWGDHRSVVSFTRAQHEAAEAAQHRQPPAHPAERARLEALGPNVYPTDRGGSSTLRIVGPGGFPPRVGSR